MPIPLDVPWQDIRDAVAAGVPMSKVAKQFSAHHPDGWQPLYNTIRKRAERESWLVPSTVIAHAKKTNAIAARKEATRQKTKDLVVQSLSEMGDEGSIIAGKLALDLLREAQNNPENIARLVDTKDLATTIKTLRLVAGMDKQGPVVALNLWGDAPTVRSVSSSQPVQEIEEWNDEP